MGAQGRRRVDGRDVRGAAAPAVGERRQRHVLARFIPWRRRCRSCLIAAGELAGGAHYRGTILVVEGERLARAGVRCGLLSANSPHTVSRSAISEREARQSVRRVIAVTRHAAVRERHRRPAARHVGDRMALWIGHGRQVDDRSCGRSCRRANRSPLVGRSIVSYTAGPVRQADR